MMKVGLYFGSFNPVHTGHLIIANHVLNFGDVQEVWFVVSPQNPLKETHSLLHQLTRLRLVRLAIKDQPHFKASNVEFDLPKPSYTIDTLSYLKEKYPNKEFSVVMGGDSFQNIKKWKNYETLLRDYAIIIYERPGFTIDLSLSNQLKVLKAPLLDISSTFIRELIKQKKSIQYLVHDEVMNDILANGYYSS